MVPGFDTWLKKSWDRFICPEIQNELLQIMRLWVLRKVAGRLAGQYYTIMADETKYRTTCPLSSLCG